MRSRDLYLVSWAIGWVKQCYYFGAAWYSGGQQCLAYEQCYYLFPLLEKMSLMLAQTLKSKERVLLF